MSDTIAPDDYRRIRCKRRTVRDRNPFWFPSDRHCSRCASSKVVRPSRVRRCSRPFMRNFRFGGVRGRPMHRSRRRSLRVRGRAGWHSSLMLLWLSENFGG